MIDLACVGHAAVDHHFEIEAFPARPTKTPATAYHHIIGGMAANAAVAATRLGGRVRLLGRVGDDEAGRFVRAELAALGVADVQLEAVAGAATSVSSVVVDAHGERQVFNHRGSALTRAHPLDVVQLAGARALLVDPRWPAGAAAALRWAREHGVFSMLDADVAPLADLQAMVPLAQWAVFSEPGLAAFAPGASQEEALHLAVQSGAAVAMVTLGERGVLWTHGASKGGLMQRLAGYRVKATDTTGAGDVFHAALALALGRGQAEDAAVRWACAAAALKCSRGPGVLGTPTAPEIADFMTKYA